MADALNQSETKKVASFIESKIVDNVENSLLHEASMFFVALSFILLALSFLVAFSFGAFVSFAIGATVSMGTLLIAAYTEYEYHRLYPESYAIDILVRV